LEPDIVEDVDEVVGRKVEFNMQPGKRRGSRGGPIEVGGSHDADACLAPAGDIDAPSVAGDALDQRWELAPRGRDTDSPSSLLHISECT
jgi:hypothetical protein